MLETQNIIRCASCNRLLSNDERPCTYCGSGVRHVGVKLNENMNTNASVTVSRNWIETNRAVFGMTISLTVAGLLVGVAEPLVGIPLSLGSGLASIWVGRNAFTKVSSYETMEQ